jgi:two-component system sensor histidine kinase BaeS
MKLALKIFLAFLLTSALVVVLMVGTIRFYVARNFSDYVNKIALERLDPLAEALAAEYETQKGWRRLVAGPGPWREMLLSALPLADRDRFGAPGAGEPAAGAEAGIEPKEAPPVRQREPLPPRLAGRAARLSQRVCLFDEQRRQIAGGRGRESAEDFSLRPITVDGRTVGWLGLHKRERFSSPLDSEFLREQSLALYLIGGGILALAAIVSFLLARHLLAPVRQLAEGTRALAEFRFETRIDVRTRDELGQLAADFNRMADTLKQYETLRRQWVSDISHELRTPLAVLRGEIEALQDGVRRPSAESLESLHAEVLHLGKLVEDLHLLSLADSQSLLTKTQPVKPVAVLAETLAQFGTRLEAAGIRVRLEAERDAPGTLLGDAGRLAQLFANLLENTLRYVDSPGALTVSARRDGNRMTLAFEDSGPGVPAEALPRLFDRLYRVDRSRSRALGGSGLGLAICKQIVESHGGSTRAAHAPSGGLRVEIELPLIAEGASNP